MYPSLWQAACLLTLIASLETVHAQHGLITRPTVGPYFDQIFPPVPPTLGNWSVVEAYPSLTF
jgi:hypothetical protein